MWVLKYQHKLYLLEILKESCAFRLLTEAAASLHLNPRQRGKSLKKKTSRGLNENVLAYAANFFLRPTGFLVLFFLACSFGFLFSRGRKKPLRLRKKQKENTRPPRERATKQWYRYRVSLRRRCGRAVTIDDGILSRSCHVYAALFVHRLVIWLLQDGAEK